MNMNFNPDIQPSIDNSNKDEEKVISEIDKNKRFIQIPLSEEQKLMKRSELAEKLGTTPENASYFKQRGYYTKENPEFAFSKYSKHATQERVVKIKEYMSSVTQTKINSIESVLGDKEAQKEISELVDNYREINNTATRFLPEGTRFNKRYKLSNGDEVLIGDLTLLNLLIKSNVFRDASGKLQVLDPQTNLQKPFAMVNITKTKSHPFHFVYAHINSKDKGKDADRIYPTSFAYWARVAPNAVKQGVLRNEDFRVKPAYSRGYEIFGGHERKIKPNKPQVFFSNEDGGANYYIGRGKFVGTDKKIDHENTSIRLLDDNTAAIIESIHGKKEILYTFPLLSKGEYLEKENAVVDKFNLTNKKADKKTIRQNIVIGGDEMSNRIKEYSITDYIKQKSNETPVQYAERVSRLSDISYTLGKFRDFMTEVGVGAQNFKWEEQLVLADAFTSVGDKQTLIDFAQKYGENGLRTFLSVEQGGKEMGSKITKVGDSLSQELANKVFEKYGEIVDVANSVGEEVKNIFADKILPENSVNKIKAHLLLRAKNLLVTFSENTKKEINITEDLDRIKKDLLITGVALKELHKNGEQVSLEDVDGMSFESMRAKDLSTKDKVEMTKIYELSRPTVTFENAKHIKILLDEFKTNLEKENTFIYNVKVNEKIMAFAVFYQTNPDTLHVGGLSFHPDVKNPTVGVAVMDAMLKGLGKYNIEAEVHSKNQILAMYTKRFGFKITKELPNLDNSGELYYLVEREKDKESIKEEKLAA